MKEKMWSRVVLLVGKPEAKMSNLTCMMGSKDEGNEEQHGSYDECNEGLNDYT